MKRAAWAVLALVLLWAGLSCRVDAQEVMVRLYLVPSEAVDFGTGTIYYGPLYFQWRFGTGTLPRLGQVDYGFVGGFIVLAELTQEQHDWLIVQPDVISFPDPVNLDTNIAQADTAVLREAFEGFNVPADWLTAANTYRELLRGTYGVFRFAQRYDAIAALNGAPPNTHLFDQIDLDTQYRDFPTDVQSWFSLTVADYGLDPAIIRNNATVRQMLKAAGDFLARPLEIGGYTF